MRGIIAAKYQMRYVGNMKDAFVMLEGDIVQWAHAQAASQGTSVTRLLSAMLRERISQKSSLLSSEPQLAAGKSGAEKGGGLQFATAADGVAAVLNVPLPPEE